jgi:starch phosphorylase
MIAPEPTTPKIDPIRAFAEAIRFHVTYSMGKRLEDASPRDFFLSLSYAARQRIIHRMLDTEDRYNSAAAKRLYYFSMEYLVGRALENNLLNLGILEQGRQALELLGADLEAVREVEADAALGNGGLGRLAACFLDSLATLGMPGYGYGINYEFGLFKQQIENGEQKEQPDLWFGEDSPWLLERREDSCVVPVYGRVEDGCDLDGRYSPLWANYKVLVGIPYDMPIVGYGGRTVNYLRLYTARSSAEFDMQIFNAGDYMRAVEQKIASETISKVLYPSDNISRGRELRLVQEYFLVACALRDIVKRYRKTHRSFDDFPDRTAIQLNDTHPALAIVELMRMLVDEQRLDWERAWQITEATFAFTNHTLLPEALEKWPVPLLEFVLPRHLQIIFEINRRFLGEVERLSPGNVAKLQRMSLIEESEPQQVRMAYLSIAGSHSVNGVAELHTQLLKHAVMPDFYQLWPKKFNNKTNGITQRRWLLVANPLLSSLIDRTIGGEWLTDLDRLRELEPHATDGDFQSQFMQVKRANKERLARIIADTTRIAVNPDSLFDVQIKRIHEYKRQLLNVLHIIHRYFQIVEDGVDLPQPRTFIFGGKAAPGYKIAKLIISLIHGVGEVVNKDPRVRDQLKVVFVPDYRVTLAEKIMPGADLSEQISTAGKEASGTGNMKMALNGALTIGTLDGANIEIKDSVGDDNIYIFGLTAAEAEAVHRTGSYDPWARYHGDDAIRRVMDSLAGGLFCPDDPGHFRPIFHRVLAEGDVYLHLADFHSYLSTQDRAAAEYNDRALWARKAIVNVARVGRFSSDRTVREYARDIWGIEPVG